VTGPPPRRAAYARRVRILFVYSRPAKFVRVDLELLRERWEVEEWAQPGRYANPLAVLHAVRRADLVIGWFASWHTFWPITVAWLLRKPSLLVVGGFDTANVPEIGYGYQQGGARRHLARWIMGRASRLITNSRFTRDEVVSLGIPAERVTVVFHGFADTIGELPSAPREPVALTVSNVAWLTVERKGLLPFVEAAPFAPEFRFVLVGEWADGAAEFLREVAAPNVELTGRVSDDELADWYRRASVYVQASRHEGFGMTVAEAMLAGCIPVVTAAGALPEVAGDVGERVEAPRPDLLAEAVRQAHEAPASERARARGRVLEHFPLEARRQGLFEAVERLLA
jgi:glycosyltransferase involved in cell wall biosynthesis